LADCGGRISRVESDGDRTALWTLLSEFHRWMADHEPRDDPEAELTADRESLTTEPTI
jgi:hypothetical protein